MRNQFNNSKSSLILSMVLFGTIGIFRKYIPLSSASLALTRGLIGAAFLLLLLLFTGRKPSWKSIKANLIRLLVSGAFLGINWILLFEAYRYTSVATATLCYYMAPIFVILAFPILLKERLTGKKLVCVAVALAGMVLVSGIAGEDFSGTSDFRGILFGIGAAALYAAIIILNKKITGITSYDKTIVQLVTAAVVLFPYVAVAEKSAVAATPLVVALVGVVGIVHTGIAYALYFGSMKAVSGQTVALLSYIDPVVAVFLSVFFLREPMSGLQITGAVLIISATMAGELPFQKAGKDLRDKSTEKLL